jgi:hypothetical protein
MIEGRKGGKPSDCTAAWQTQRGRETGLLSSARPSERVLALMEESCPKAARRGNRSVTGRPVIRAVCG